MSNARGTITVLVAVGLAAVLASPALAQRLIPSNVCGDPVYGLDGHPLSYSSEHLEACLQESALETVSTTGITRRPSGWDKVRWSYAAGGTSIGATGIIVNRPEETPEIIVGAALGGFGRDRYWYALRFIPESSGYEPTFVSEIYSESIRRIAAGNVSGGSGREIVVALEDGTILLYDLQTKAHLGSFASGLDDLEALRLDDIDGDGLEELLVANDEELLALRGDGSWLWRMEGVGGHDLVVGQMDDDPSLEVAVTSGSVVDVDSRTVQWTWPDGFGFQVEAADIDGDGLEELIAAKSWYFVWSFDVDRQLPKWSIPIDGDISAIWVGDADNDARPELLVGQGQWGSILAFDTATQTLEWEIRNPEHGVTGIAVGDPDGDRALEVLWGAGATSTGPDRLFVADMASRTLEWQDVELDPPFIGPAFGDVDGDGVSELVVATFESESGYSSGRILVFDPTTLRLRATSPPVAENHAWTGLNDLILRNVDDDPALEIVVAADDVYDGLLEIYDFDGTDNSFSLAWTNATQPDGAPFHSVEVTDVDLDGVLEVIAGGGRAHSGADGVFLYVYDLATGEEDWHSFQLGGYSAKVTGVAVLADGGGHPDILAMVDSGAIYVFDGVTKEPLQILFGSFTSLTAVHGASRGFLVGDASGTVTRFERLLDGYAAVGSRSFGTTTVKGMLELPNGRFAVAAADAVTVYASFDGPALWTTTTPAGEFSGGLAVSPFDRDLLFYCAPHALLAVDPNQPAPRPGGLRVLPTP